MVEEGHKVATEQNETLDQLRVQDEVSSSSEVLGEHSNQENTTLSKLKEAKRKVFTPNKKKTPKMDEGTRLFLRRERDKIRQRLARMHEDEDKRKQRLEKDKMRKRLSRKMENDFDKLRRRDKDRERQALKRKFEKEQKEKKKCKGDSDFSARVSMVDIGSTIVIKDSQIAVERADEEIEVTVEVADEERLKDFKLVDDHSVNRVEESGEQSTDEVRVPDDNHLEVVKLDDGVCLQEVKVTHDHSHEEDDAANRNKAVADDHIEEVTEKSKVDKVKTSEKAENHQLTDNQEKAEESMELCVETDVKNRNT